MRWENPLAAPGDVVSRTLAVPVCRACRKRFGIRVSSLLLGPILLGTAAGVIVGGGLGKLIAAGGALLALASLGLWLSQGWFTPVALRTGRPQFKNPEYQRRFEAANAPERPR